MVDGVTWGDVVSVAGVVSVGGVVSVAGVVSVGGGVSVDGGDSDVDWQLETSSTRSKMAVTIYLLFISTSYNNDSTSGRYICLKDITGNFGAYLLEKSVFIKC